MDQEQPTPERARRTAMVDVLKQAVPIPGLMPPKEFGEVAEFQQWDLCAPPFHDKPAFPGHL